jgi:ethanolamine utilization protein EutQ (cupin superfamily)
VPRDDIELVKAGQSRMKQLDDLPFLDGAFVITDSETTHLLGGFCRFNEDLPDQLMERDEVIYVISGRLETATADGRNLVAEPGDCVQLSAGVKASFAAEPGTTVFFVKIRETDFLENN